MAVEWLRDARWLNGQKYTYSAGADQIVTDEKPPSTTMF
jgi:hypothetical protein